MAKKNQCKGCRRSPVRVHYRSGFCVNCLQSIVNDKDGYLQEARAQRESYKKELACVLNEKQSQRDQIDAKDREIKGLLEEREGMKKDLLALARLLARETDRADLNFKHFLDLNEAARRARANEAACIDELPPGELTRAQKMSSGFERVRIVEDGQTKVRYRPVQPPTVTAS